MIYYALKQSFYYVAKSGHIFGNIFNILHWYSCCKISTAVLGCALLNIFRDISLHWLYLDKVLKRLWSGLLKGPPCLKLWANSDRVHKCFSEFVKNIFIIASDCAGLKHNWKTILQRNTFLGGRVKLWFGANRLKPVNLLEWPFEYWLETLWKHLLQIIWCSKSFWFTLWNMFRKKVSICEGGFSFKHDWMTNKTPSGRRSVLQLWLSIT